MSFDHGSWLVLAVLVALGGGALLAIRFVLREGVRRVRSPARRAGFVGMVVMTGAGFLAALVGASLEELAGGNALVALLHTIAMVCWFPAFLASRLRAPAVSPEPFDDLVGALACLLVPAVWFLAFASAAALRARLRRPS